MVCRQLYNHALYRLNEYRENHGRLPSMTALRSELPDLKQWLDGLSDVYPKVLQTAVERSFDNLKGLSKLKENGYGVGPLKWKATGIPKLHVQSVRLQARQEGRSDCAVPFENRRHSDTAPPRHARQRDSQASHAQKGTDR